MPLKPKVEESVRFQLPKKGAPLHVPIQESITSSQRHNVVDAGIFMGRSFRVSWGPKGMLAHSGFPVGSGVKTKSPSALLNIVTIEKVFVRVGTQAKADTPALYVPLLEEHFHNSKKIQAASDVPVFVLDDVYPSDS